MASNNRSGTRGGNRRRNNNPEGRNQYSGVMSSVRDKPLATAAAIGGAVAAGVFLWSRRNQLSDQIYNLSDQISEWRDGIGRDSDTGSEGSQGGGNGRTQAEIAEEALTLKETGAAL